MPVDSSLQALGALGFAPCLFAFAQINDERTRYAIIVSAIVSALGFFATKSIIPVIKRRTLRAGLHGKDINKKGTEAGEKDIPESLGLAPGLVFLVSAVHHQQGCPFQVFYTCGGLEGTRVASIINGALWFIMQVCIILFQQLHYYDVASLIHKVTNGTAIFSWQGPDVHGASDAWYVDKVVVSKFLIALVLCRHIDMMWAIHFVCRLVDYNAALATICFMLFLGFADDVLDIPWRVKLLLPCLASLPLLIAYSGGTGVVVPKVLRAVLPLPSYLELGVLYKAYMIALVIFCANSINILAGVNGLEAGQTAVIAFAVLFHNLMMLGGPASKNPTVRDGHLFSAYLMLPLATTTMGLLQFNWYPAQVFVGDTFTYFAGMTLAVAGILGHFSETLLLFFVPQIINFVYSLPQLLKIVPCPRHRLPRYDPSTGLLHATPNLNLVNLTLQILGPCTEKTLCVRLLVFQALCCILGFAIRPLLAGVYK